LLENRSQKPGVNDAKEPGINDLIAAYSGAHRRLVALRQLPLALLEFAGLLVSSVFWWPKMTESDGHSVMVIPGYGGSDRHYAPLRSWLTRLGYRAVPSEIIENSGWSQQIVDRLGGIVQDEFRGNGKRVTLIGHSLGGLQARSVARLRPDAVGQIVALGAPLAYAGGEIPATVAIASIYTPSDLPFEPQALESHAENIEVRGTHNGLAANRRVYEVLAGLLSKGAMVS
jgi:pimeloyl-ACP methyl ester carboxylesterase